MSKWNNPPDFDATEKCFMDLAAKKAQIRIIQEQIKEKTREIKAANPRSPWKVEQATPDEQKELAQLESDVESLETYMKFYILWADLYKASGYRNR